MAMDYRYCLLFFFLSLLIVTLPLIRISLAMLVLLHRCHVDRLKLPVFSLSALPLISNYTFICMSFAFFIVITFYENDENHLNQAT